MNICYRRSKERLVIWDPSDGGSQISFALDAAPAAFAGAAGDQPSQWGMTPLHRAEVDAAEWLALVASTAPARAADDAAVAKRHAAEAAAQVAVMEAQAGSR